MATHVFDTLDAAKYGILEAVILYNIRHWCAKNRANRKHFHDGNYWTYNSIQAWQVLFPYASVGQIRRAIDKLRDAGAIKTGNHNASAYDRTTWYCVQIDLANSSNGFDEDDEPIPDVNTDINQEKLLSSQSADGIKQVHIPYEEIIGLFNNTCETLPKVKLMTESRKSAIKSRWMQAAKSKRYGASDTKAGLEWWARFFKAVDASDFLSGRNVQWTGCSFDWVISQSNFTKIIEGNYKNKAAA